VTSVNTIVTVLHRPTPDVISTPETARVSPAGLEETAPKVCLYTEHGVSVLL
jgi:hypothetical protein